MLHYPLGGLGAGILDRLGAIRDPHKLGRSALTDAALLLDQNFPLLPGTALAVMQRLERLQVLTGCDVEVRRLLGRRIALGNERLDGLDEFVLG